MEAVTANDARVIKTSGGAPIVCAERAIKGFCNGNRGNQKITEGIFIGTHIRKLINDEEFIATLKEDEKRLGLHSSTLSNTFQAIISS
ncbi:hypothetical protein LAZ67_18000959 [Cordylochernes scorpioides]|uniref:Uncharacterized protein n=1 Tax=Cordylochernes scorpioides TaxID=51811 RepID=A0ABY6LFD2_9ARAC|nr:hypothetical protein LAZ67_18000959 [Cordylochernes scorpioides]